MAMSHCAVYRPWQLPLASAACSEQFFSWHWERNWVEFSSSFAHGLPLRLQTGRGETGFYKHSARGFCMRCSSKVAMRVLQEAVTAGGTKGAKLLVRRSRSMSRAAQMEVLEELVRGGQCELVLPMYEAVRKGARYKWDAYCHARIVAMVAKDQQMSANTSSLFELHQPLTLKEKAELECALIESYASQGLLDDALKAFHRLCDLALPKARLLANRAMVRAYCFEEKPIDAEKMLMEMRSIGHQPSLDDCKLLLLGYGKLGMFTDMERIADELQKEGLKIDTSGFNMMISSYCSAGKKKAMVEVFLRMVDSGVRPSLVSWNALTKACHTLSAVGLEGSGALASPMSLLSRLHQHSASPEEFGIIQFLLARGLPLQCVTFSSNTWQLDLHNMSLGTASIVLPLWFSSLREQIEGNSDSPVEVRLITGWGKHSKVDIKAPVRRMVMLQLEAMKSPFRADSENRGAFITRVSLLKSWLSTLPR